MDIISCKYRNKATGEGYEISGQLTPVESLQILQGSESALSIAWGKMLRVVSQVKGWNRFDIEVVEATAG